MSNDSQATPLSSGVPQDTMTVPQEPIDTSSDIVSDPIAFFRARPASQNVADYARRQAERHQPVSLVVAWAQAARLETALWAIFPILIGGLMIWTTYHTLKFDRIALLALATVPVVTGVNLLRNASHQAGKKTIAGTPLRTFLAARVGAIVLLAGLLIGGILVLPRLAPLGIALAFAGAIFAIGYALLPATLGAFPGEELIPALALGPGLFFVTLLTQPVTRSVVVLKPTRHIAHVAVNVLTPAMWLVAVALGSFLLAILLVTRLQRGDVARDATSTRTVLGVRGMRVLALTATVLAYVCVLLAGFPRNAPHSVLAVLLSLPAVIIPVTGMLRARNSQAFHVVRAQLGRAFIAFNLWLIGGLAIGGIYLRLLSSIPALPGTH